MNILMVDTIKTMKQVVKTIVCQQLLIVIEGHSHLFQPTMDKTDQPLE